MQQAYTVKVVDGLDRAVSTRLVVTAHPERAGRQALDSVQTLWTHLPLIDREAFGFYVWDEAGTLVAYG